jgi:hypothetical protein
MDEGRWTIDFAREGREDRRQKSEDRNFELGGREGVEAGGQGIGGKKKADGDGMRVWENRLPTMMKKLREEIKGRKRFLTPLFDRHIIDDYFKNSLRQRRDIICQR